LQNIMALCNGRAFYLGSYYYGVEGGNAINLA
jgi:hypothetical protein